MRKYQVATAKEKEEILSNTSKWWRNGTLEVLSVLIVGCISIYCIDRFLWSGTSFVVLHLCILFFLALFASVPIASEQKDARTISLLIFVFCLFGFECYYLANSATFWKLVDLIPQRIHFGH